MIREFCALEMPILLVPGNYPQLEALDSIQELQSQCSYPEDGVRETTLGELFPESLGPGCLSLKQ